MIHIGCKDCYHNGCCEHYCSGMHYLKDHCKCDMCGEWKWIDDLNGDGLCEECAAKKEDEND